MKIFRVFYYIAGVGDSDDVTAFTATQAMEMLETFLLEWGYPNNAVSVEFAQDLGYIK